jgi:hypothetical protein
MKGNLTQLAISYDGWTGNPTGADTKSIVDLMQYEPPLCFFNG